jgi:PKD repeat protein
VIYEKPMASFSMVPDSIAGLAGSNPARFEFTNQSVVLPLPAKYKWNAGVNQFNANDTTTHFTYQYNQRVGSYWVTLIAQSAAGCLDTVVKKVQVIDNVSSKTISKGGFYFDAKGVFHAERYTFSKANWYNASGQLVYVQSNNEPLELASGVYFVAVFVKSQSGDALLHVKVQM